MSDPRTDYTVPADTVHATDLARGDIVLVALPRQQLVVVLDAKRAADGRVLLRLAARSPWADQEPRRDDITLTVPARAEFTRTLISPF